MSTSASGQPQDQARETAPERQTWVKPVLVEYGHLAKLTRGPSGTISEPNNFKMCL